MCLAIGTLPHPHFDTGSEHDTARLDQFVCVPMLVGAAGAAQGATATHEIMCSFRASIMCSLRSTSRSTIRLSG
jgi:hypothetical protein